MSAISPSAGPAAPAAPAAAEYTSRFAGNDINFPRMLKSEWLKLWTLRSTWWTLGLTVILMAGLSVMFAAVAGMEIDDLGREAIEQLAATGQAPSLDGLGALIVVIGYSLAQLTVAILGVLVVTNEYSSGMIRATLSATPRRLRTLWAKLMVLTATTTLVAVLGLALAWLLSYPILDRNEIALDFSDGAQVRAVVGAILYLVMIAWLALGVGTILRHTAGGISAVIAAVMVLPMIFGMIVAVAPTVRWVGYVARALPSTAGEQVILGGTTLITLEVGGADAGVPMFAPWTGFAVLAAYAIVSLALGAFLIKRRDA